MNYPTQAKAAVVDEPQAGKENSNDRIPSVAQNKSKKTEKIYEITAICKTGLKTVL